MKNLFSLILVFVVFNCFAQNEKIFPDKIQNVRANDLKRILGTKIYLKQPPGYQYIKELTRFQKDNDQYLQVTEADNNNFTQSKRKFKEKLIASGAKLYVLKDVKIGQFDGVYCEAPSEQFDKMQVVLVFGDETFVVFITGVCKIADEITKGELRKIVGSVYFDKFLQKDPLELANFDFDHSITNFKFSTAISNIYFYSKDGLKDSQEIGSDSFQIGTLPKVSQESTIALLESISWNYEKKGVKFDKKDFVKTTINNYPAVTMTSNVSYNNKNGISYMVALIGEKSSIFFLGSAYNDVEALKDKYVKTVGSISIK